MYQAETTIRRTLKSVINQSYRPLEVIIVNDGSKDDSLQVVEEFMHQYPVAEMVYKLINQSNGGVSKARNTGMHHAQGAYIALLDADDEWLPEKLSKQMAIFEAHPDIDFLGTNRNGEYWEKWMFKRFSTLTNISARLLLYKTFFVTPTVVFKREVLYKTGYFDESQKYAEEGNYWIRVCHQHHCVLLNESLAVTGSGKPNFGYSGLSSNLKEMEKGELRNMKLGYRLGIVGALEYVFLVIYSLLKYLRRIIIVRGRKKHV